MTIRRVALVAVTIGLSAAVTAERTAAATSDGGWHWDAAVGYDSFTHSYALASVDTSETVSESRLQLGWEGRSSPGARDAWRLRLEGSAGSELWRQRLEADWRRRDRRGATRLRTALRLGAQQYRPGTDYSQSSDVADGRFDAQGVFAEGATREAFALGWASAVDYARPSPLEQDQREVGAGVGLRARGDGDTFWQVSARHAARAYPDSAVIDRHSWSTEVEWSRPLGVSGTLRVYERSERRLAADPATRPDAWLHWLDLGAHVSTGATDLVGEMQVERWNYASADGIHVDSWRFTGLAGVRRGDVLVAQWLLGLAGERFDSADEAESYVQIGLRAGVESYGSRLSGTCTVEHGRRDYAQVTAGTTTPDWTDFDYWRLWLLADYRLTDSLALAAIGTWEPESHDAADDDITLSFASLRLVWRP